MCCCDTFCLVASHALQSTLFGMANETKYLISGIECFGNETSISDCTYEHIGGELKCLSEC